MSKEEFLAWVQKFEEDEKRAKKVYEAYSKKLTLELTELVFDYNPEMRHRRQALESGLNKISEKYMLSVRDRFECINFDFFRNKPPTKKYVVPKPKTKEEIESRLQELLKDIPGDDHEGYKELFWEDYEDEKRHEDFLYAVFNKMKEVLVEFYFDTIVRFDSAYLRYLDYSIYLMCAGEFLQDVYGLE